MISKNIKRLRSCRNGRAFLPELRSIYQTLLVIALSGAVWRSGYAADLPAVSNDPTRAQQYRSLPQEIGKQQQAPGFVLPVVPEQGEWVRQGGSVELKRVVFEGNTVFSAEELDGLSSEFLNRKLAAADLETLRRKVSQYYIDHGYVNSGAMLVSQSLAEGILRLKIIEGRLVDVRQSGLERLPEDYLRDRLIAGSGEPLNAAKLQDRYRQLLADPLIQQLNGRLLPGSRPGEAVLDLQVTRGRPYQLYLGADDYQTPSVGAYTGRIGGWVDNLLAVGERIDAHFVANGGALGYNTGISVPVTAHDTRVSFRYSDTSSTIVEAPLDTLNITNRIVGFDGGISQPIYRTFADDVTLGLNFVVRQNRTQLAGECLPVSGLGIAGCETQASVLRMTQRFLHRGEQRSLVFWSTFNAGLDLFGATTNQPGLQSGEFFSWLGQSLFSEKLLDNGAALTIKASIQLADSPLLNLERYALGGAYTVRGYRENTYVRDNGFNTSVEIKYPLYGGNDGEKNSLYLVPFLDYGGVWDNATAVNAKQPTHYLYSSGIGLSWQYKQLSAEFYWAHAFTPPQSRVLTSRSIQDDGIHFRVNLNVF